VKESHCEAGQTLAVRQRNTGPPVFVSAGNQNISTLVPFLPGAGGRSSKLPPIVHAAMPRPCPPVTSNPLGIQLPASLLRQPDSNERNLLADGMVKRSRDGETVCRAREFLFPEWLLPCGTRSIASWMRRQPGGFAFPACQDRSSEEPAVFPVTHIGGCVTGAIHCRLIPLPSSPNLLTCLSFFPSFRPGLMSGAQVFHDTQRL